MIKRRNIDPSLMAWLMNYSGLGPGIGDVHYVVDVDSAYYSWLRDDLKQEPSKIHFNISDGYNALMANRNDVLLVYPGTYTQTATLTWAKTMTHMFGVGNPLWRTGWKILITNATTGVAATMDITASGVSMGGFAVGQQGAFSSCLTALRLTSTHFHGKQLEIFGHIASEVAAVATASSLELANGTLSGYGSTFEDCSIGVGGGAARSVASAAATNGVINFAGTSTGAAYIEFHKCRILSRSSTAYPCMIKNTIITGIDRYALFKDCFFHNFSAGHGAILDVAIHSLSPGSGSSTFVLKDCMGSGITEWQAADSPNWVHANMPIVGLGGGLGRVPTSTAGN